MVKAATSSGFETRREKVKVKMLSISLTASGMRTSEGHSVLDVMEIKPERSW